MKILFCDNSLRELLNFRKKVIYSYVEAGWCVVLVAPKNCGYVPDAHLIKLVPIEMQRSGKNPFQDLRYCMTLRRIYKEERPDYIFHYTIKPNIYGSFAAKTCGIRSSAMIAGLGYVFNKSGIGNRVARWLYKFALKFADYVLVLNKYNYDYIRNRLVPEEKLMLLRGGEGVDLVHFYPRTMEEREHDVKFLMISRVLYDKGYQEYVDAAKAVHQVYPNVKFQLLGSIDVEYPNHVPEEQVKADSDAGHICYLGYHLDVVPYVVESDCIVLPSFHEGLSRVLMEALAMGKPIITTDIPGCRETVEENKNGYLVKPKDTKSLEEGMKKFLSLTTEERQNMGRYGRQKAEREFDICDVVKTYHKITSKVMV